MTRAPSTRLVSFLLAFGIVMLVGATSAPLALYESYRVQHGLLGLHARDHRLVLGARRDRRGGLRRAALRRRGPAPGDASRSRARRPDDRAPRLGAERRPSSWRAGSSVASPSASSPAPQPRPSPSSLRTATRRRAARLAATGLGRRVRLGPGRRGCVPRVPAVEAAPRLRGLRGAARADRLGVLAHARDR